MMIADGSQVSIDLATIGTAAIGLGLIAWRSIRSLSAGSRIDDAERRADRDRMIAIQRDLSELVAMHKQTDQDGRPIWWFPTGIVDRLDRSLAAIERSIETQKRLTDAIKRLCDHVARDHGLRGDE